MTEKGKNVGKKLFLKTQAFLVFVVMSDLLLPNGHYVINKKNILQLPNLFEILFSRSSCTVFSHIYRIFYVLSPTFNIIWSTATKCALVWHTYTYSSYHVKRKQSTEPLGLVFFTTRKNWYAFLRLLECLHFRKCKKVISKVPMNQASLTWCKVFLIEQIFKTCLPTFFRKMLTRVESGWLYTLRVNLLFQAANCQTITSQIDLALSKHLHRPTCLSYRERNPFYGKMHRVRTRTTYFFTFALQFFKDKIDYKNQ